MTDEEKKAAEEAAKAAAAKKAQEDAGKKPADDPEDDPEDKPVTREQYKKIKDEAIQNRRENKELKARLAKIEQGLGLISGKEPDKAADEIAAARASGDARARRSLLIAEIASSAPDAHNARVLYGTDQKLFDAVDVDLETDTVDVDGLEAALKTARKRYSFLFKEKPAATPPAPAAKPGALPSPPRTGAPAPDGSGSPGAEGTLREQYKALLEAGRTAEAQKFYKDNKPGLMAELKAAGR